MSALLLCLAVPSQAWGTGSKFEVRRTNREPLESRVIDLLMTALGLGRDADLSEPSAPRFGVRVNRNGKIIKDFYMAEAEKTSYLTYRYHLPDTTLLVGSEPENRSFLEKIESTLWNPCFPFFLRRRSRPLTLPLVLDTRKDVLEIVLWGEENQNEDLKSIQQSHRYTRLDCDVVRQGGTVVQDLPASFNPMKREFGYRHAREAWLRNDMNTEESAKRHDAVARL